MFQMFFFFFLSLFPSLKRFEGLEKIMVISLDLFVIFCHIFHSAYVFASRKELSNYLDTHTHTQTCMYTLIKMFEQFHEILVSFLNNPNIVPFSIYTLRVFPN